MNTRLRIQKKLPSQSTYIPVQNLYQTRSFGIQQKPSHPSLHHKTRVIHDTKRTISTSPKVTVHMSISIKTFSPFPKKHKIKSSFFLFFSCLPENSHKTTTREQLSSVCLFSQNWPASELSGRNKISESPSRGEFFFMRVVIQQQQLIFIVHTQKKVENFSEVNECVNTKSVNLMGLCVFHCILWMILVYRGWKWTKCWWYWYQMNMVLIKLRWKFDLMR